MLASTLVEQELDVKAGSDQRSIVIQACPIALSVCLTAISIRQGSLRGWRMCESCVAVLVALGLIAYQRR